MLPAVTPARLLLVLLALSGCGSDHDPPSDRIRPEPVRERRRPAPPPDRPPPPTPPPAAIPTADDGPSPPAGFSRSEGDRRIDGCGDATVEWDGDDLIAIGRDGRRLWRPPRSDGWPWNVTADWCFDVTGDGAPELHVLGTGSIHTGQIEWVVSLGPRVRSILTVDAPEENLGAAPVDLGSGPPWPLYGSLPQGNAFDWCGDEHPGVPDFPAVFALRGGRYVPATREYPALLRSIRARAARDLTGAEAQDRCGPLYEIFTTSLLLGDWATQRGALDERDRTLLERNRRLTSRFLR